MVKSCYCNVSSGLKFHYNIDEDQLFGYDMKLDHNTKKLEPNKNGKVAQQTL
jgi:hypothetical protein